MAKASKIHWVAVRVKFDKPVHKKEAARLAGQVLETDYYPYSATGGPEVMDVTSVKSKAFK